MKGTVIVIALMIGWLIVAAFIGWLLRPKVEFDPYEDNPFGDVPEVR